MKKHVKIWLDSRNKGPEDIHYCEWCSRSFPVQRLDVHHVYFKGMGGGRVIETPQTLIALCRDCHTLAHANRINREQMVDAAMAIVKKV